MISIGSDNLTLAHEESTNRMPEATEEDSYLPTVGKRNHSLIPPSPQQNKYLGDGEDTMHRKRSSVGGQARI